MTESQAKALVKISVPVTLGHSDAAFDLATLTVVLASNSPLVPHPLPTKL
jgi:hypothetical protein